jgi:hypothetical protein
MSNGPELIKIVTIFRTLNGAECEAECRVRISSFGEHECRNIGSAQFGATELMCSDRSRFSCMDTLSVGIASKHRRAARCASYSRCERMGLNVARMGRVGNLNYGLETRGRRIFGVLLGVYINSLLKWTAKVFCI